MSELGTKLRDARIEKGYTLNTLQQMTKIQKKYLVAIEEGRFEEMPGSFYTRAFVKQYADMVGLNGDDLLLEHQEELERASTNTEVEREEEQVMPSRLSRTKEQRENSKFDQLIKYAPFIVLAVVVITIMAFIVTAIQRVNQNEKQAQQSSAESVTLVSSVTPSSAAVAEFKPAESSSDTLKANEVKVGQHKIKLVSGEGEETTYHLLAPQNAYKFEVKASNFVWVGIFEDDMIVEDRTVNEGETFTYTMSSSAKEMRIRLGYPEGGKIYVNGTEIPIDNQYFIDSILFVLSENLEVQQTEPASSELTSSESQQGFQGPAVLDPANQSSEQE